MTPLIFATYVYDFDLLLLLLLVTCKENLWIRIMYTMDVEVGSFVDRHVDTVIDVILSDSNSKEVGVN